MVLALFLLLFFGGGGWYFSGLIRSDALLVEEYEPEYDVRVLGATEATITLALPSDPAADLTSDEILGVIWENGYGRVGDVVSRTEEELARSFELVDGEPPAAGTRVSLEGTAYPDDPAAGGFDLDAVEFEAAFGTFEAWHADGSAATWAILVHGRGATRDEGFRILPAFVERSMPALLIEYRNDPGAPATDDRLGRFGATEWEDLEGAVQSALDRGADDIVLVGFSMGGAIGLSFLEHSRLAPEVRAVVLDAPALKLGAMVDARAGDTSLPLLPITVPMPLTATAKAFASLRFDVDWDGIDYLGSAPNLSVPVLILHGIEDETVPIELSRSFADARPDLVSLEEFAAADHVRSWNVDPDRYLRVVGEFLDEVLEGPSSGS
jgi:alpha-beta hydrolase superfamily lysophospholipase